MRADAWWWRVLRQALAEALALVLPISCAGCGEPDVGLCEACRAALVPARVHRTMHDGLPIASALVFEGAVARIVRALKEEGRTGLAADLAPALGAAVRALCRAAGGSDPGSAELDVVVVPVPTSRASFRRRGYRVVDLIARRAGVRTEPLLRIARQPADQRGLGREQRRRNIGGSLAAASASAGRRVVIVDDVVTTGATLAEAARALEAAGAHVVGAATVARTPRRSERVNGAETHR